MVYILLADGFEELEALAPCDMLRRAGVETRLVSVTEKLYVKGAHGINVMADLTLSEINIRDMEMLVFPGGMPGSKNLDEHPRTDLLVRHCVEKNRYLAAICAAPMVLGKRNVLVGKKAICFLGFEKYLAGAQIMTGERVVRDGNIVTAIGAGAAVEFGLKLVEIMKDKQTADDLRESIK